MPRATRAPADISVYLSAGSAGQAELLALADVAPDVLEQLVSDSVAKLKRLQEESSK